MQLLMYYCPLPLCTTAQQACVLLWRHYHYHCLPLVYSPTNDPLHVPASAGVSLCSMLYENLQRWRWNTFQTMAKSLYFNFM